MSFSPAAASVSRPLSIVHVVDSLEVGGLERVTADLAIAQQQRGHQVTVFSIMATQGFKSELVQAGVDVIEGHKRASLDWRTLSSLRQTLRQRRADIVHAHNYVPNYHAALAAFGLRCKQICTLHDMGQRLSNTKLRILFKLSMWRTRQVMAVGKQVLAQHLKSGTIRADRSSAVLNGIPVAKFKRDTQARIRARQELGLTEDELVIGCVGRLVPLKNHRRMVDVMPALLARHPRLRLVVIGSGECDAPLKQQISDLGLQAKVLMAGHRANVGELLAAFDIFALPSQTEGLSIALLEACASGLAIVASAVGGNPEIVQDRRTGLLIAPDDNPALEQALDILLSQPALGRELGQAAQQWVQQHGSVEALADACDAVYARALS